MKNEEEIAKKITELHDLLCEAECAHLILIDEKEQDKTSITGKYNTEQLQSLLVNGLTNIEETMALFFASMINLKTREKMHKSRIIEFANVSIDLFFQHDKKNKKTN